MKLVQNGHPAALPHLQEVDGSIATTHRQLPRWRVASVHIMKKTGGHTRTVKICNNQGGMDMQVPTLEYHLSRM